MIISLFNTILGCALGIVLYTRTFLVNEKPACEVTALLNCRNAASYDTVITFIKLSKFVINAILANVAMTIWGVAFDIFFSRLLQPTKIYKIY